MTNGVITSKTTLGVYKEVLSALSESLDQGDFEGSLVLSETAVNVYNILLAEGAVEEVSDES